MSQDSYVAPAITDLGSFAEKTLDNINKAASTGDTITISGVTTPAQGGSVISVS